MRSKVYKTKIASKLIIGITTLTILSSFIAALFAIHIFYKSYLNDKVSTLLSYAYELERDYEQGYNKNTIELYDHLLNARIWILREGAPPIISHQDEASLSTYSCHSTMSQTQHVNCTLKGYDSNFVNKVLNGEEVISYSNSAFYYGSTLSVGVPIERNGQTVGAILLHAPIEAVQGPISKAFYSLIVGAILSAFFIFLLCRAYALRFTSSIGQIQSVALELMKGNYQIHSSIERTDEIGDLSCALNNLASKLEEARIQSQQLEQVRQDFVANVSHEFRTPLTVIKGNAEALIDCALTHPEEAYENILNETLILERLVTDLLDLSRLQQNQIQLHIEPLFLPEIITDALRSIRQLASTKAITIYQDIEHLDFPIHTDYLRFRQILIILLSNAVNYTPSGGSIHVQLYTLAEVKEQESYSVILKITDTGIGISEETLPFIWDRFYKVNTARDSSKSSGLGLAIAKNLLRLLNIEAHVESTLGEGTTFTLFIPINIE